MPEQVVAPGEFPVRQLDQADFWIAPDGCAYRIDELGADECLASMDWCLGHATSLRNQWSTMKRETFNKKHRARRWVLERPAIKAFMKRITDLEAA